MLTLRHLRPAAAALAAFGLVAWSQPGLAQPAANVVKRLTDLEDAVAQLTLAVNDLRARNTTLAAQLQAMGTQLNTQTSTVATLQGTLTKGLADGKAYADTTTANTLRDARAYTDNALAPVADKIQHFSRSGNNVLITGANVYIRNGMGSTVNNGFNGLGNLILGYNEGRNQGSANPDVRTGSHNLIVGVGANYARNASIITGINNSSGNNFASVYGGTGNYANAVYSSVVGGYNNTASGGWATILGGRDRTAANQLDHLP